jgi:spermidine synthase
MRLLCFDDATESRVSLEDPWKGHCEYTEYFHTAWLWNTNLSRVLMIGLGGGSTQRSFEHYYPGVSVQSVEIDPAVVRVARNYFGYKESERQKVEVQDGRMFLRRNTDRHDFIILDAYVEGRYGSAIPQHLATKEFFELVRDHLATNGVVAYNVIGSLDDWHADIVGAIYRTLKTVFPQVYFFPARTTRNVVLVATQAEAKVNLTALRQRGALLVSSQRVTMPGFRDCIERFVDRAPASAARSPVLTDDYAPVEGLAASQ